MERLPFAELAAQRSLMIERLRQLPIADEAVGRRARAELQSRIAIWWGGALPPSGGPSGPVSLQRPVVVQADRIELYILRAISPMSRPAVFGVEPDGAIYTADSAGRYQIFVCGLSPLLDEMARLCLATRDGRSPLVERAGRFFTDFDADFDEALAVVEVGPTRSRAEAKSFWSRIASSLPWVHEESEINTRPITLKAKPAPEQQAHRPEPWQWEEHLNDRPVHELVIDFDAGSWPASGVLKELGYKVGRSGHGPVLRRRILHNALTVELLSMSPEGDSYIQEWGPPNSMARAAKIERCLMGFASNARRRNADMSDALADWDSDLEWFRDRYSG